MKNHTKFIALVSCFGIAACQGDFLTGGQLSTTPNAPTVATNAQYFVGIESNIFYQYSGEFPRVSAVLTQQDTTPIPGQYKQVYQYQITEALFQGDQTQFAGGGGLADVRRLEALAAAAHDSLFVGTAQVQEALLMGLAADVWGDLTYTDALKGMANPPLDKQLTVFDSLQALLSRAIVNMSATGPTNAGPGSADVSPYGGNAAQWIMLAHSLKARFYMHTAESRGATAYQAALVEAPLGITNPANDYKAVYSGGVDKSPNYNYFVSGPYVGYVAPGRLLDTLLYNRHDPRRTQYFAIDPATNEATAFSAALLAPDAASPIATAAETHLTWAEAAYRTGDQGTALAHLNIERSYAGLSAEPGGLSGQALLQEILTEEYINDFLLGDEAWKLYRRTCFPNMNSTSPTGQPMPGRLYYDPNERITNTNIPTPGTDPNGIRNQDDPPNANSDITALGACKAGA